jgi:putative acetyltransferase
MVNSEPTFRWASREDYDCLGDIIFDAVRNGPSAYTEEQRAAWVPAPRRGTAWNERLATQDIIVVELAGKAVGFMSLVEGYIDFAYLRPTYRGQGLFRRLLQHIEDRARANSIDCLCAHVSLTAHEAFAASGFEVQHREEVTLGSERLARFSMAKRLSGRRPGVP